MKDAVPYLVIEDTFVNLPPCQSTAKNDAKPLEQGALSNRESQAKKRGNAAAAESALSTEVFFSAEELLRIPGIEAAHRFLNLLQFRFNLC